MTFSQYGVTAFTVQGSTGGGTWATLGHRQRQQPGQAHRHLHRLHHDHIRINVTAALASYARITEIEAWGTSAGPPPQSNSPSPSTVVSLPPRAPTPPPPTPLPSAASTTASALASTGAMAVAGTTTPPTAIRTGSRSPSMAPRPSTTSSSIPSRTTMPTRSSPPTRVTFTQYGVTGFTVQGWTGSGLDHAGHRQRQQPGQAHRQLQRLHHQPHSHQRHRRPRLLRPPHRNRGLGKPKSPTAPTDAQSGGTGPTRFNLNNAHSARSQSRTACSFRWWWQQHISDLRNAATNIQSGPFWDYRLSQAQQTRS